MISATRHSSTQPVLVCGCRSLYTVKVYCMELFRAFREQTQHAAHIKLSLCAHTRVTFSPAGSGRVCNSRKAQVACLAIPAGAPPQRAKRPRARAGRFPSRGKRLLQKVESLQISSRSNQHTVKAAVAAATCRSAPPPPPPPPCACTPGPMRTPRNAPPRPRTAPSGAQCSLTASPASPAPDQQPGRLSGRLPRPRPALCTPVACARAQRGARSQSLSPEPACTLLLADLLHNHGQDVDRPRLRREDHPEAQEGGPPVEGPERRLRRPVRLPGDPGAHHHHAGGRGQHRAARQEDGRHLRGARPLEDDKGGSARRPEAYDQGRGAPLRQERAHTAHPPLPRTHPRTSPRAAPRDARCDWPRARRRTRCSRR